MKSFSFLLSFFVWVAVPVAVSAQSAASENSIINKSRPKFDPISGFDTFDASLDLSTRTSEKVKSSASLREQTTVVPAATKSKVVRSEVPFVSMMPVARLKSNSKILLADLDPDFPFHYNMPVKKSGTAD